MKLAVVLLLAVARLLARVTGTDVRVLLVEAKEKARE